MVGTKRQKPVNLVVPKRNALACSYVNQRWLGGMLTNFKTVKTSIKRLEGHEGPAEAGLESLAKKNN